MKNIIIFYQVINRERPSCEKLKKALELSDDVNAYVMSIDFEHDIAIKLARKTKIDMILMPWMYQDSNYYLMEPFIRINPEVIIVNLHHEQIASEASIARMLPTGEHAKNSTVHFVWGDNFKEALLSAGVKENLIFVTGNMRTDEASEPKKDRKSLAEEFGLDTNKKWILFSENRGWVLTNSLKKEEHLIYMGYSQKDVIDNKIIAEKSLKITIEQMNNLTDDFFAEYELIYRPHPGTRASGGITNKIKIIDKYPIYEWLDSVDINIVWASTTIFESDIKGVPSFVYEPIANYKRHKTYGLEQYQTISNLYEIDEKLIEKYHKEIKPKKVYERYIGKVDGKCVSRTKDAVDKILDKGIEEYRANRINYDRKMFYKTILFQKVTRLFVKLNILEKVKYPRSAYELKKDIPYKTENKKG